MVVEYPPGLAVASGGLHQSRSVERKAPRLLYANVHVKYKPQIVYPVNNNKRDSLSG